MLNQKNKSYFISNKNGMKLEFISFGAVLRSCILPGNERLDVVLGFDELNDYLTSMQMENPPYFGCIVGRYAGRIRHGKVKIGDEELQLTTNNGGHHLHGGFHSLSRVCWDVEENQDSNQLTFSYVCPAGSENYPGELKVQVTYSLTEQNELKITMRAVSTEDTIINLTQHHYWNLGGHASSVNDQEIRLNSTHYLEKYTDNIPTGNFEQWCVTPMQEELTTELRGELDHTFVISDQSEIQATLTHPTNGWKMLVKSNQPAAHLFIGCGLPENLRGKEGVSYHSKSGVCFEMQNFPDAPNHTHFPSCVLQKDEVYENNTTFHFVNQDHE
jgi:aldose 1-epimerase